MREIFTELDFKRMSRNLTRRDSREGIQKKKECRFFGIAGQKDGGGRRGRGWEGKGQENSWKDRSGETVKGLIG